MPPNKRKASSSVSAPTTPRSQGKSAAQNKMTPKASLRAGNAASKRKASTPASGGNASAHKKVKTATKATQKTNPTDNGNEVVGEDSDIEFEIECPAKPLKKNSTAEDIFRGTDGTQIGLPVDYTVKPSRWARMKSYNNIKYSGLDIRSGDFAYFATNLKEPDVIPEEETLASNDPLKDERENNYIAMIMEARAETPRNVYVRVMYAYWPEELPQGRQPHHGMKEIVMSNRIDILKAQSINGKIKVERIDDAVESVDGIYWRQTFDISKRPAGRNQEPGILSKLRTHCRCRQSMNPDQTMYICRYCTMWHHDDCLIQDVLEKAWAKHKNGTLGQDDDDDTLKVDGDESIEVTTQGKKKSPILSSIKTMASNLFGGSPAPNTTGATETADDGSEVEAQVDGPADSKMKKTSSGKAAAKGRNKVRKRRESAPWDGKLSATIDSTGTFVKAHVVDEETGEIVWTTALSCFNCDRRLE